MCKYRQATISQVLLGTMKCKRSKDTMFTQSQIHMNKHWVTAKCLYVIFLIYM